MRDDWLGRVYYVEEQVRFNMHIFDRLHQACIVPVVVLEDAANALPTAKALLAGGIDVMEITFRTAAAADAIRSVAERCSEMMVGAGTIVTLEQCKYVVECGAKFIVSPGFNTKVVDWCIENSIPVLPGCVTPTEIMAAMDRGLRLVKFFPANIYGGLSGIKALSGPFESIKFIPTGGVSAENIAEYMASSLVHAVGGSWLCSKTDIDAREFKKISNLCIEARKQALGYEIIHMGINTADADASDALCRKFKEAFDIPIYEGTSSSFVSNYIEVMKFPYLGKNGHIAIRTNRISAAIADLEKKGFVMDWKSAKYKKEKLTAVYLKDNFGGFAVHLLQK